MPLFELSEGSMVAYRRLNPTVDYYEREIEDLVWGDLEAFTGEALFPVARQAKLVGLGVPDVLALDATGRVVIIEIKRDIDRSQLAQCLEYAGWARGTSIDEVAGLYDPRIAGQKGPEAFFKNWRDYTETEVPRRIDPRPRLILIANDFHPQTHSALEYLRENNVPVTVVPVSLYEHGDGRKVVDVEADHEPQATFVDETTGGTSPKAVTANGKRVTVSDLIDAGLVEPDEPVEFVRPKLGHRYEATINGDGTFRLADGQSCPTPSRAAMVAADVVSYDGWYAWAVKRLGGAKLVDIRARYVAMVEGGGTTEGATAPTVDAGLPGEG